MKIGLVCPYNLMKGGGVQECVFAMQTELAKRGHKVCIITPQPRDQKEPMPDFVCALGRSADMKSPFHTTAQVSVSVDVRQVDQLISEENFDVLHFHEPWVPLLSRQLLLRSKSRNIATFHAKLPDTMMSRTIERVITPYTGSVLKYLDVLTAVSEPAAAYVRSLTKENVQIIPNGIDLHKYSANKQSVSKDDNTKMIFYIGRLEQRKGLSYLLKAMVKLQEVYPDVILNIAGDGPDRQKLERQAQELGVNAEFLGRVDEKSKIELLLKAKVFCSPARYGESFGIVLLEAMAAGTPIVAGDNPGYVTVMRDTGKISLVNPQDTADFARRLDLMLTDESLRSLWDDWAQKTVKQYDYSLIVDQYEKLYQA